MLETHEKMNIPAPHKQEDHYKFIVNLVCRTGSGSARVTYGDPALISSHLPPKGEPNKHFKGSTTLTGSG